MDVTEVTSSQLRSRLRPAGRSSGWRRLVGMILLTVGVALVLVTPVLASPMTFRLQGSNLAMEFVAQPYRLAPGTLGGRHVRLEAGLLGFRNEAGMTTTGYCVDARTHRRHQAVYTEGDALQSSGVRGAAEVSWLLGHAFPNGPSLLGPGPAGQAASSSAVQAAIWHFSDQFELDPAGAAGVDSAYARAYQQLIREAEAGAAQSPVNAADAVTVRVLVSNVQSQRLVETVRAPVETAPPPPPATSAPATPVPTPTPSATPAPTPTPLATPSPSRPSPIAAPATPVPVPRQPAPGPPSPSAPPPPAPPVAATTPTLPTSGETIVSMPRTGRGSWAEIVLAAGLVMAGSGLLVGQERPGRPPRRVRCLYRPAPAGLNRDQGLACR